MFEKLLLSFQFNHWERDIPSDIFSILQANSSSSLQILGFLFLFLCYLFIITLSYAFFTNSPNSFNSSFLVCIFIFLRFSFPMRLSSLISIFFLINFLDWRIGDGCFRTNYAGTGVFFSNSLISKLNPEFIILRFGINCTEWLFQLICDSS